MLPAESGLPIRAFAVSRDSIVGDRCSEIGTAASIAAPRVVVRRVIFLIVFSCNV
jgi:hypothetical protein